MSWRAHHAQPGEKLHVLGRSLIRGLHLWQGASRLIGRHLPFRPKMHLARFWISVLEKRSSAQQPTVLCMCQQLFLLSLCQRSRKCALVIRDDAFSGWNFTSPLVADAKAFCLRCVFGFGCGLNAHVDLCVSGGATHLCVLTQKMSNNSIPAHYSYVCVHCAAVDILGNKTQPGSEICVRALGSFLFLPFIGKCAVDANNMRSFVLTPYIVKWLFIKMLFQYNWLQDIFQLST